MKVFCRRFASTYKFFHFIVGRSVSFVCFFLFCQGFASTYNFSSLVGRSVSFVCLTYLFLLIQFILYIFSAQITNDTFWFIVIRYWQIKELHIKKWMCHRCRSFASTYIFSSFVGLSVSFVCLFFFVEDSLRPTNNFLSKIMIKSFS